MGLSFELVWFDSLGAKSVCVFVETPDVRVLIDPGAAVMHPGFPATEEEKSRWLREARGAVLRALKRADVVVISHYHYDHFVPRHVQIYRGKHLFVKDPNTFINDSQRERAWNFFERLHQTFGRGGSLPAGGSPRCLSISDPMENLPLACGREFGDYTDRRNALLKRGQDRFRRRVKRWERWPWIKEIELPELAVSFADGREVTLGMTRLRFSKPLFHGVEFSAVGWVFATIVEHGGEKLIHSGDINGPIIEDYAQWIINEHPNVLILDGPMTYMLGYILSKTNLKRAVENGRRLVEESGASIIVYDHHLLREPMYREHTQEVWEAAQEKGVALTTAAEYMGKIPKVLLRASV